jgi:hypothetical protein
MPMAAPFGSLYSPQVTRFIGQRRPPRQSRSYSTRKGGEVYQPRPQGRDGPEQVSKEYVQQLWDGSKGLEMGMSVPRAEQTNELRWDQK